MLLSSQFRLVCNINLATIRKCSHLVTSDALVRLKKELDSVLALQADLDASEHALQATHTTIEKGFGVSQTALPLLKSMERSHDHLLDKIEALYVSLNIHEKFPELEDLKFEFVQIFLIACNLKINIRKRAIGSFFEWDKLDHAVGGKDKVLGV